MSASRLSQARKAVRPALKGRLMMSGPSGAGKTRCLLMVATALAEGAPILGVDTEKESMLTYADDFDFVHLAWHPPYDAAELGQLLAEAGDEYGAIIIDSSTHFWRKEGGVLDIAGGKFSGWKEARPVQEALVESILTCKAHVLLGARSKVEHVQETEGGRQVVRKIGMAVQQDDDLEFELNVAVDLTMDHTATISKSRTTSLPVGRQFKAGQITEMATIYRDWLKGGEPPAAKADVDALTGRIAALPEKVRRECKQAFFARFGRPEQLRESAVADADQLIATYEGGDSRPFEASQPGESAEGADGTGTPATTEAADGTGTPATTEAHEQGGTSEADDAGESAPELSPTATVSEGPGDNGSSDAPGPDTTAALGLDTSKLITKAQAQKLHKDLGRSIDTDGYGLTSHDQDDLIFCVTGGRTSHASELTIGEEAQVRQFANYLRDGRMTLGDVHRAAEEHRSTQLDTALEQSLAQQRTAS